MRIKFKMTEALEHIESGIEPHRRRLFSESRISARMRRTR